MGTSLSYKLASARLLPFPHSRGTLLRSLISNVYVSAIVLGTACKVHYSWERHLTSWGTAGDIQVIVSQGETNTCLSAQGQLNAQGENAAVF